MGERKDEALETFKISLQRIKDKFTPERVYLFGSRARGEELVQSDLDIIIVSKKFCGIRFMDRITEVLKLIDPPVGIDLLCYTPQEFESNIISYL